MLSQQINVQLTEDIDLSQIPCKFNYLYMLDSAFKKLNTKLKVQTHIESYMSGATGCMAMIHNGLLITANVGDSRAVLYQYKHIGNGELIPVKITRDHTPDIPSEKKRITNAGGQVYKMKSKFLIIKIVFKSIVF